MVEIIDLVAMGEPDVSDDDLLVIWDSGAPSANGKQVRRDYFLKNVVRSGNSATLATVDADVVNAPEGAIDALTVGTALIMGATVAKIMTASDSVTIPVIAAGAAGTATMAVLGAVAGDVVLLQLPAAFPDGLQCHADVSAGDTITLRLFNANSIPTVSAGHTIRALVIRVS